MAERRMFSRAITNSAKFLKMPLETQALYFHLAQNADDDGVVEGFSIMRLIGASEDNLKVLEVKGYIEILNDDLVLFISDWLEHNKIRKDRKKNSIYCELLKEKKPDVILLESKPRADRNKNLSTDGTSQGQPMDSQWTTDGRHRLGKDRLGEDSTGENPCRRRQFPPVKNLKVYKSLADYYSSNINLINNIIAEEMYSYVDDGMDEKLIEQAIRIASTNNKRNWGYIKAILNNCINLNIKTLEEFEAKEKNHKRKANNTKNSDEHFDSMAKQHLSDEEYKQYLAQKNNIESPFTNGG